MTKRLNFEKVRKHLCNLRIKRPQIKNVRDSNPAHCKRKKELKVKNYQIEHNSSPPIPKARASRSVIIP